jgi:hypothetical protein
MVWLIASYAIQLYMVLVQMGHDVKPWTHP